MKKSILLSLILLMSVYDVALAGKLSSYPFIAVLNDGDYIPVIASATNANINWQDIKALISTGINWQALPSVVQNYNVNWNDIILAQKNQGLTTGINWNDINPVAGGINWMTLLHSAPDNTIVCVKAGQPGKCNASFSASGAGSCNCI